MRLLFVEASGGFTPPPVQHQALPAFLPRLVIRLSRPLHSLKQSEPVHPLLKDLAMCMGAQPFDQHRLCDCELSLGSVSFGPPSTVQSYWLQKEQDSLTFIRDERTCPVAS
eukprot:4423877-Amphidinium_carterae.1